MSAVLLCWKRLVLDRALLALSAALLILLSAGVSLRAAQPEPRTGTAAASPEATEPAPDDAGWSRGRADELSGSELDPRKSISIRGAFLVPHNDLNLTTGSFPQIAVGVHAERLIHGVHQIRPNAEWWYFRQGHQSSVTPTETQTIDTKVRALVFGVGYLYRIGGADKRLSAGAGLYLIRWSVDSVDTLTLPTGTARGAGTSSWVRLGESYDATYRLTHRLELEGRWMHSHYGYEHIPVNVAILGAGWRF